MINYDNRISRVRKLMEENSVDALFLPQSGDAEYLTGIRRQRPNATQIHRFGDWLHGIFITYNRALYVVPKMSKDHIISQISSKSFVKDIIVLEEGKDYLKYAKDIISNLDLTKYKIAVPKIAMAKTLINFKKVIPEVQFTCTEDFTCGMRMIKEKEEIERMNKAAKIIDEIFEEVVKKIKIGITEIEIAREIDYQMLLKGAEGTSFNTNIKVMGPNVKKSEGSGFTVLCAGCHVAFDFGCVFEGYCNDFGRTIYLGKVNDKLAKIHQLIMEAQKIGINAMIPNKITAEQLDKLVRDVIADGGYPKEFSHRLGHGIGIDVHEYPYLSTGYSNLLQENMTFTVEPSIRIPGELNIRVEDVVLVTPSGGKSLNNVTKDLIVIE
jgi:Xaa-Pro aminopeptidase